MSKMVFTAQDLEHVKLHIWEMKQLIEEMREEKNPKTKRLERLLERFMSADPNEDRA